MAIETDEAMLTGEAVAQRAGGHVLVDEHLLALLEAEADEADQVLVVHPGEQLDLGLELVPALHGTLLRPLDGDELPVGQHAPVHLAVPSVPQLVRLGEVVGAPLQLLAREPPRPFQPRRAAPLLAPSPGSCSSTSFTSLVRPVKMHGKCFRNLRRRTKRPAELFRGLLRAPPLHERVDGRSDERDDQDSAANRNPYDGALALGRRHVPICKPHIPHGISTQPHTSLRIPHTWALERATGRYRCLFGDLGRGTGRL